MRGEKLYPVTFIYIYNFELRTFPPHFGPFAFLASFFFLLTPVSPVRERERERERERGREGERERGVAFCCRFAQALWY